MRLEEIEYFVGICAHESLNQAAQAMHISQQGLSQSIRNLERSVGGQLFYRTSKGVTLTEFGREFYEYAKPVLESFGKLEGFVDTSRRARTPQIFVGLRISSNASAMNSAITCTIEDFRREHPEFGVHLVSDQPDVLRERLLCGELDTVHTLGLVDRELFDVFPIFSFEMRLIASENAGLSNERTIPLSSLAETPFVLPCSDNEMYRVILSSCKNSGFTPNVSVCERNAKTLLYLTSRGYGVSFLPRNSAEVARRLYPGLVTFRTDPPIMLDYAFVLPRSRKHSHYVELFLSYMTEKTGGNFLSGSI